MPWWIWLVLVLFMLTMLVGGGAYACIRGYHAFKDAIKVGAVSYTHLTLPTSDLV